MTHSHSQRQSFRYHQHIYLWCILLVLLYNGLDICSTHTTQKQHNHLWAIWSSSLELGTLTPHKCELCNVRACWNVTPSTSVEWQRLSGRRHGFITSVLFNNKHTVPSIYRYSYFGNDYFAECNGCALGSIVGHTWCNITNCLHRFAISIKQYCLLQVKRYIIDIKSWKVWSNSHKTNSWRTVQRDTK